MQNEKKSTFFGGAAILLMGSVMVKVIGAIYRIPLGNLISDEAYVDFTTAYNVYNLFLTIATAGLPVALSKTVAEANTLGRKNQVRRVFSVALTAFFALGILSFIGMTVFGGPMAEALGDESAVYCIRALAPSVLCVCVMATFRGYYQGHYNMKPTAVSQVIESFCKMVFGLILIVLVLNLWPGAESYRQRVAAVGAIIGVTIGSVIALVYIISLFLRDRRGDPVASDDVPDSRRAILKRLLVLAVPITLGSAAMTLVTLIDTRVVMTLLERMFTRQPDLITPQAVAQQLEPGGVSPALYMAQGLKGIYDKLMAIYNLPPQLMVALTASVIPAVSTCLARGDGAGASRTAQSALRIGVIMALPMGAGLFALGGPVVSLLYPDLDIAIAAPMMSVLGLATVFVCVMSLCNSVLQAHGRVGLPVIAVVVGGAVKVAVNYLLVGDPAVNIKGAPIGSLACFAVVAALDVLFIKLVVPQPPRFLQAFGKPLVASALMAAAAWGVCGLVSGVLGSRFGCLAGIATGVVVYAALILLLKVFTKDDLALMPKGDKIAKILRIS